MMSDKGRRSIAEMVFGRAWLERQPEKPAATARFVEHEKHAREVRELVLKIERRKANGQ